MNDISEVTPEMVSAIMRSMQLKAARSRWAKLTNEEKRAEMRRISAMRECVRRKRNGEQAG